MKTLLLIIFLGALFLRLLYFPNNIYFGFDQARDAYQALEIAGGNLKIIGPSTSFPGLFHGVLYYYLLSPFYFLGNMSPEFTALILRILNALGVFLIFYLGKILFNKKIGLLSAILFAISFEQTQFAIYMGNPAPAVISVLLMYLGLAAVIFAKNYHGLPLTFLGLGFSIQFQFALLYLTLPFFLIVVIFYKDFKSVPIKLWLLSLGTGFLTVATFVLAEVKFGFPMLQGLLGLSNFNTQKTLVNIWQTYFYTVSRMLTFNFSENFNTILATILGLVFLWVLWKGHFPKQLIFLGIWFFSIFVTFVIHGGVENLQRDIPLFYPNVGVSLALLIFVAFLLGFIFEKYFIAGVILLILIFLNNFNLIQTLNPQGTISEIDVQQGMLLGDQKKSLDFLYTDARGEPFAVKAVTLPFFVNTTWSYLFEWYGKNKYGYLPLWNGKNALGYPGNLTVQEKQEGLPESRYVIVEPTRGIATHLINDYLREEGYFTKVIEEKKFGSIVVQKRIKI
ncbi:MAG: hypothetical protein HYW45_00840 [Candidatus Daviesbacteria bacterium]|nr:MAG: hypothetical protein HYW45_00840 [Candidatus Daviesbacteria bacterium]